MASLYKVWCTTEGAYIEGTGTPVEVCPNDAGHGVRAGSLSIIQENTDVVERTVYKDFNVMLDEASDTLIFSVKYANGTIKTGTIDLVADDNSSSSSSESSSSSNSSSSSSSSESSSSSVDGGGVIEIGEFTGDGSVSQIINLTSSLQVQTVWVWTKESGVASTVYVWTNSAEIVDDHANGACWLWGLARMQTDRIIALPSGGKFTVDDRASDSWCNKLNEVYEFCCWLQ